jgi:hypothetical protein
MQIIIDSALLIVFVVLPMLIGYSVTVAYLWTKYFNWLWKDMDEQKRYMYIKVRRW